MRREPGEGEVERPGGDRMGDAGRHRNVRTSYQNLLRQSGQNVPGAGLDEDARPRSIHGLDLVSEPNRLYQVVDHDRDERCRVGGQGARRGVGEHRDSRRRHPHRGEAPGERVASRRHERRVERARHVDGPYPEPGAFDTPGRLGDALPGAGDHRLCWSIPVGDPYLVEPVQQRGHPVGPSLHGQHRPEVLASGVEDGASARLGEVVERVLVEGAAGAEGHVLAIAVPSRHVWRDAQCAEQPVKTHAGGTQGGLRDVGLRQGLLPGTLLLRSEPGRREHERAQRLGQAVSQERLRPREGLAHLAEVQGQALQHFHLLRALPREEERHAALASEGRRREMDPPRIFHRGAGVQRLCGPSELRVQVIEARRHDREGQPAGASCAAPLFLRGPHRKGEVPEGGLGGGAQSALQQFHRSADLVGRVASPDEEFGRPRL